MVRDKNTSVLIEFLIALFGFFRLEIGFYMAEFFVLDLDVGICGCVFLSSIILMVTT